MENTNHRVTVRLDADQLAELTAQARRRGCGLAPAIRLLIADAAARHDSSPASLATLVAAEQVVLMVASVLPDGQRRLREAGVLAIDAAQARLELFEKGAR
jgi:hypothetical protein